MPADHDRDTVRIGLISDTHGWLDPRAVTAFQHELPLAAILHAGDVGSAPEVLWELGALAPLTAVLGNCDYQVAGFDLDAVARLTVAETSLVVLHDVYYLDAVLGDVRVVICGHSHRPRVESRDGVLFVNPGSASQRRSEPGCTVGVLDIPAEGPPTARIVRLDDFGPRLR